MLGNKNHLFTFRKKEKGATMVEMAIVFPLVLLVVLILIDFMLYLVAKGSVERAAKQAAAFGAVVDGLENEDNSAAVGKIKLKALEVPNAVLSRSMIDVNLAGVTYKAPLNNLNQPDYVNFPIGVEISANYRPILPFLPRVITVQGYAYREKSELSSLPVPLDCLGRRIQPGVPLPPIGSCPCPGTNDPLYRRRDASNPEICDCIQYASRNNPQGICRCDGGDTEVFDPSIDACKCRIKGQDRDRNIPDSECQCLTDRHEVVGDECVCKDPFVKQGNSCVCRACPIGAELNPETSDPCDCRCKLGSGTKLEGNKCVCDITCPPGQYLEADERIGKCTCKICPSTQLGDVLQEGQNCTHRITNQTASNTNPCCTCNAPPELVNDACGGPDYFDATKCECLGECDLQRVYGLLAPPKNCRCILEGPTGLYAKCGGAEYSNPEYCNCKCILRTGDLNRGLNCSCDLEALARYCRDEQGGLPIWPEVCGCHSGGCTGKMQMVFDPALNANICVCPLPGTPDYDRIRLECRDSFQEFDPVNCSCVPPKCESFLIGTDGSCGCGPGNVPQTLIDFCRSQNPPLPIDPVTGCKCGRGCDPNKEPNAAGVCECIVNTADCPLDSTFDPNTCACKCNDINVSIRFCNVTQAYTCDIAPSCARADAPCSCDANGTFTQDGQ